MKYKVIRKEHKGGYIETYIGESSNETQGEVLFEGSYEECLSFHKKMIEKEVAESAKKRFSDSSGITITRKEK